MTNNAHINIDRKSINRESKLSFILDGTSPKYFLDEVHDRLKYINENFFYNKLVIFGYDSFRISDSISDGDSFPIYIEV